MMIRDRIRLWIFKCINRDLDMKIQKAKEKFLKSNRVFFDVFLMYGSGKLSEPRESEFTLFPDGTICNLDHVQWECTTESVVGFMVCSQPEESPGVLRIITKGVINNPHEPMPGDVGNLPARGINIKIGEECLISYS